jgi:hypothetical protein
MDVEEAEYNIQLEITDQLLTNRRSVWQVKYIAADMSNFISKRTKSAILLWR